MAGSKTKLPKFLDDDIAKVQGASDKDDIILIMGPTGSGKSSFINTFLDKNVADVGHGLTSCTTDVQHFILQHPLDSTRRLILVDTPGFDHTNQEEADILRCIAVWLGRSYYDGMKLAGIIYLQAISQDRIGWRNLTIFRKLCGNKASEYVVLVTTKWEELDETDGARREEELKEIFWNDMIRHGSRITPFKDSQGSAQQIVEDVLRRNSDTSRSADVNLRIQEELVDLQRILPQTDAGRFVTLDLQTQLSQAKQDLAEIRELIDTDFADEGLSQDFMRTQQSVRTIMLQAKQMKIPLTQKVMDLIGVARG